MIPFKDDNVTRTFPFVTVVIIGINILVYILQVISPKEGRDIAYSFGAIPYNLLSLESTQPIPVFLTVFTSMFMHGGLLHLGGNMLYFWIFGDNIEDSLGHIRFLFFYLVCGMAAAYAHALSSPGSQIPMIGASGAISGILGAYVLLFPAARVHTLLFFGFFIQVVRIPALIVIGFWAIIQFLSSLLSQGGLQQGGVAWFAHVGGFFAGLITIKLWLPRRFSKWS
ncbi:MAG: rhomboid family intramembrane serine protease [Nitrospirae bacterium]|nr:MAG: rhomboid family intramembrane serine protease [Nitrospirota bacterium]